MSYHAPHTLSLDELEELERSEMPVEDSAGSRFVVKPVPEVAHVKGEAAAAAIAESEENEGVKEVWVVYDYDCPTGRYSNPVTAYTSRKEAARHKLIAGMVGWHRLDVWKTVEDWEHAGKPIWKDG
jgi:hypothetical protein